MRACVRVGVGEVGARGVERAALAGGRGVVGVEDGAAAGAVVGEDCERGVCTLIGFAVPEALPVGGGGVGVDVGRDGISRREVVVGVAWVEVGRVDVFEAVGGRVGVGVVGVVGVGVIVRAVVVGAVVGVVVGGVCGGRSRGARLGLGGVAEDADGGEATLARGELDIAEQIAEGGEGEVSRRGEWGGGRGCA